MKDLYAENFKTLMKKTEDTNKQKKSDICGSEELIS